MPSTDNLPEAERPRAQNRASYLLLALSIAWCFYWFLHAWHYWEDDAWIHLEFARSVASGQGFAFNGRIVAGDTAPLWVLLLAAMHVFVSNWVVAGKVLTVLGAIFGFAGIYAFARKLSTQLLPEAGIFPAAIVLLIAVNPYTCYWIFSGMETISAAGLACFAVLAATRTRPTPASFLTACLLAGLAPLLRPEMLFLTVLLLLPLWAQSRSLRANVFSTQILGLVLLAAPLTLWSIYSFHAFGHILPNTNAAKRAGPGQSVVARLITIYSVGFPVIVCGVLAAIGAVLFRASAIRKSFRAAIHSATVPPQSSTATSLKTLPLSGWIFIVWVIIATVFYIANHTFVQTRYIFVPAPGLIIIVLLQFSRFSNIVGRTVYVIGLAVAVGVSVLVVVPFIRNKAIACDDVTVFAHYLHDQLPPDAPVAIYSIGQVAFVSQHPIVDTGGITQPESIPYLRAHPDATVQWATSVGAKYYVSSDSPEPGSTPVYIANVPFIGWTFHISQYATTQAFVLWRLPAIPVATSSVPPSPTAHP
jgi:hypothetical protein